MRRDYVVRSEIKEFAFTKMLTCGSCGSGITAQEKFKNLKDGTVARYVYYGCTKSRNLNCKNGYTREEELIDQLIKIMDRINLNEIGIQYKFQEEMNRLAKFQKSFFKGSSGLENKPKNVNFRSYAKYLLKEGSVIEKRELLACVKSKLVLTKKILTLEK
ncbi:MAG: zinc ribbon domain-containing protein [Candidatus Komeilibacteria bacterium]|nr:zinc ribbon domain-containing protein [Candidatus Komeilibacteria bacterium]